MVEIGENSEFDKLKNNLLRDSKHGSKIMDEKQLENIDVFCQEYKHFLDKGKTEREVVKESLVLSEKFGFKKFDHNINYKAGDKIYHVNKNKDIVFAVIGKNKTKNGVKVAVAHIDSPRLDLKPNPIYELNDIALFKTHYYGGIKKYQWFAIPLALHGTVFKKNGESVDICIGESEEDPQFCVSDLLPHLGRERMKKSISEVFLGEDLNILVGSRLLASEKGVVGSKNEIGLVKLNILKILNENYGITETDFLSAELEVVPAFKARDLGFDRSMIGAYGHDDRVCAYVSLMGILNCEDVEDTVITVLVDKEEVGSGGNTGMNSSFFRYFIEDLAKQDGVEARHVLSNSKCFSMDVNAAFDPNFPSYYEINNSCHLNRGVVVTKYTGTGGKSGSSDASAEFMAQVRCLLDKNNVIWQTGELGKVDGGGGGTVAKFVANLNLEVVDVGVPVLSMHSPFEIVSKIDVYSAFLASKAFFKNF
ncbi:MAG: aminopeptidase [Oscillospiraceae bacterium]|jgi:aspartyl aminopeptidase|nr:aminopeptidase [Oscillospiraceae bacterium]